MRPRTESNFTRRVLLAAGFCCAAGCGSDRGEQLLKIYASLQQQRLAAETAVKTVKLSVGPNTETYLSAQLKYASLRSTSDGYISAIKLAALTNQPFDAPGAWTTYERSRLDFETFVRQLNTGGTRGLGTLLSTSAFPVKILLGLRKNMVESLANTLEDSARLRPWGQI